MGYVDMVLADLPGTGSFWKMDEASGNLTDSGGGAHTGTATGAHTYQLAGPLTSGPSYGISFVTGGSGAFDAGDVFEFTGTQSFSLEAWVKPSSYPGAGAMILSQNNNATTEGWNFWLASSTILRQRRWQGGATDDLDTSIAPALNVWSHVVGTYDGTNQRIYINGVLRAGPTASAKSIQANTGTFQIGAYTSGNSEFDGNISLAAVYPSVVLTPTQIQAHFEAGTQFTMPPVHLPFMR